MNPRFQSRRTFILGGFINPDKFVRAKVGTSINFPPREPKGGIAQNQHDQIIIILLKQTLEMKETSS